MLLMEDGSFLLQEGIIPPFGMIVVNAAGTSTCGGSARSGGALR